MSGDDPIDLLPVPQETQEFLDMADAAPETGTIETYYGEGQTVENTLAEPATPWGEAGTSGDVYDLTFGSSDYPGEPTEV